MKGLVTRNTHVLYESPITSGLNVIAQVKLFVHATDADADADQLTFKSSGHVKLYSISFLKGKNGRSIVQT